MNSNRPFYTHLVRASCFGLGVLSAGSGLAQAQTTNLITNPTFEDTDGDKQPDKWKANGTADGATIKVAVTEPGVVQLLDSDKGVGVGLAQTVPVQVGHKYQFTAKVKGGGGLGVYVQYLDKVPGKEAMIRQHILTEAHESTKEAADFTPVTVTLVAPANATQARLWFYCPKIGLTDSYVKEPTFIDLGAVAAAEMSAAPAPKAAPAPRPAAAAGAKVEGTTPTGESGTLANPDMKDADGDGIPDGWRVFPDADGTVTKVSMAAGGGVQILDTDKGKGVGIQQQLPAVAGTPYTFSAVLKGTAGISLNLQFMSGKPARDSDLKAMLLDTKRTFGTATPEGKEVSFTATAPAGTQFLRAWIYSPNIGVTDVTVTKATLTSGAAVAVAAPQTNSKLIFVGDFESGNYDGWLTQFPPSTKGEIVTSPVRAGKYASKSVLTYADFKADPSNSRARRCEIYHENVGRPGEERWYGFSTYLTKGFDDDTFDIVMQIHNKPDKGEGPKSPVLTLETHGKEWWINNRWDKEKMSVPLKNGTGGTITSNNLYKGAYEVEKWTDWVYHVKWSLGDDGLIEVWKNGEKIVTQTGPNGYNDDEPFYMKIGTYKPAYRANSLPERVIYHDEVRIGNEKASYNDVAPPKN